MKEISSTSGNESSQAAEQAGFEESCRFMEALVKAWQLNGVSSRVMVVTLSKVAAALGLHGEFVATPSYVQTVLHGRDEHLQRTTLAVSRSGNYNLAKLARVMAVAGEVEAGAVRPSEGLGRLREIMLAGDEYGPLVNALAFVICGVGFAVVIGASLPDALLGGFFSLASYGVTLVAARSAGVAALQELLAAMIVAILATAVDVVFPATDPLTVTVCAVVWFIPGFGLTIAPSELMVGSTLSGILWFTNAAVSLFKLLGGITLGMALSGSLGAMAAPASPAAAIAAIWAWAAVPGLILSMAVLYKVRWSAFGGILVGGLLVWGSMQMGASWGIWQGTFLASAVLMIYADWYGRRFRVPTLVILLPCVMILLPGFAALRAVHTASTEGLLSGFQAASPVLTLIAAILGGVLVGDALAVHKLLKTGEAMKSLIGRLSSS